MKSYLKKLQIIHYLWTNYIQVYSLLMCVVHVCTYSFVDAQLHASVNHKLILSVFLNHCLFYLFYLLNYFVCACMYVCMCTCVYACVCACTCVTLEVWKLEDSLGSRFSTPIMWIPGIQFMSSDLPASPNHFPALMSILNFETRSFQHETHWFAWPV